MISEGSCDTKDWSKMAAHHITPILQCFQINCTLGEHKRLFQKHFKNLTFPKLWNGCVALSCYTLKVSYDDLFLCFYT